jgi:hypothetical protein
MQSVYIKLSDDWPMLNNMTELMDKLKKGAIDRCRERIIKARENPKDTITLTKNSHQNHGLTTHLKKMRGL